MTQEKKAVLVIGAGVGTGGAIAKRFARGNDKGGYVACVARRKLEPLAELVEEIESTGGQAKAFAVDGTDPASVASLIDQIEADVGPLEVAVYNAAIGIGGSITDLKPEDVERVWKTDCFGAFLMGQAAARKMVPRGKGTILFTGATAALRGKSGLAGFAMAKHGLRALSQSMARELGPKGIHVAHIVVDGPIDGTIVTRRNPELKEQRGPDGLLDPNAIAETFWQIHCQHPSAWTAETEVRPWIEPW